MSFGASPSDIIIVVTFCKNLYRKCRDAGGEYDEISREVRGLHTVLRHLKYEVEAPDSPLNRDHSIWGRQLAPIIGDCDFTLRQLDGLLQKYGRLGSDGGDSSPSSPRILWDKVRFGSNEMDQLGTIRVKLISHKTSLTLFLDTIQLHESGKMSTTLDNHGGQLEVILDKVDSIAARMCQKTGSIMTSYDDDDKEVWTQFRRELVSEGFSSSVLQQHKDVLRAYIREIDQKGLLDENPPNSQMNHSPLQGVNTQRWLESVKTGSSLDPPPSFDSLNTATDDSGAKEMVIREDNMKFPQSMKLERPRPETRRDLGSLELDAPVQRSPDPTTAPRASRSVQPQPTPVPKLITSEEKEVQYHNTDGSSDEGSETDHSSKRSKSPSKGDIIRTSDLLALSRALQVRPSGSPSSFRSQSTVGEDEARRSIAFRPKEQVDFSSSPPRSGPIPIPSANPRTSAERFGTSPRPESLRLAPDSYGNEIPSDAKWTKIARRLVSPEVLDQDRRRYEARPDFVAVLGALSRDEIEDYAVRSQVLRASRPRRSQPPQASPNQRSAPRAPPRPTGRDTPSTDEEDASAGSDHRNRKFKQPSKASRSYTPSDISSTTPRSGYPNPFGAPPSPMSPPSSIVQPVWMPEPPRERSSQGGIWIPTAPQSRQEYTYHPPKEREKERESSRRHHRSSSRQSHSSHPRSSNQKDPSKSRWKENLTAAGIGGAAASLLNVLAEAAEGL